MKGRVYHISKGQTYRIKHRKNIPTKYSGRLHLGLVTGFCVTAFLFCLAFLGPMLWWHWLVFPVGLLISNFVEYVAHRWVMHKGIGYAKHIYKRHSSIHHRYFTYEDMSMEEEIDLFEILTEPRFILGFVMLTVLPIAGLAFIVGLNALLLFLTAVATYYLAYEWIHLAAHLYEDAKVKSIPGLRFILRHHQIHHATRLMRTSNFNIVFPLMDLLFGTLVTKHTEK